MLSLTSLQYSSAIVFNVGGVQFTNALDKHTTITKTHTQHTHSTSHIMHASRTQNPSTADYALQTVPTHTDSIQFIEN